MPPISAKYATQFATRQVATPTYIKAIPQTGAAAATGNGGQPQQYYDQATGNAFIQQKYRCCTMLSILKVNIGPIILVQLLLLLLPLLQCMTLLGFLYLLTNHICNE